MEKSLHWLRHTILSLSGPLYKFYEYGARDVSCQSKYKYNNNNNNNNNKFQEDNIFGRVASLT